MTLFERPGVKEVKQRITVSVKHRFHRVDERIKALRQAFHVLRANNDSRLIYALRDPSPRVRATAIELIAREKVVSLEGLVRHALTDSNTVVRTEAVEALGVLHKGSGTHLTDLTACLRDPKPIVRIVAIESLSLIKDRQSIPEILPLIKGDDPLVRAYAAISLADLGCLECLTHLVDALKQNQPEAAAAGILVALHLMGSKDRLPELITLLSSTEYQVRCFVANWLPRLGLHGEDLESAKHGVRIALNNPVARADASSMSRVLHELSEAHGRVAHTSKT
jgi:HEAT repeat protein